MKRNLSPRRLLWPGALLISLIGFLLFGQAAEGRCDRSLETPLAEVLGHVPGLDAMEQGALVSTGGVVTGVYPGRDGLNGFFMQSGGDADGGPSGLFVYAPGLGDTQWERLEPGVRIQLEARLGEYRGWRQLHRVNTVRICASPGLPDPVALELPLETDSLHRHHGVLVHFPQTLVVTGNYELGRFGSLALSAEQRRLRQRSGAPDDLLHQITLDDGSYRSHPDPVPYLDENHTRRSGDRVVDLQAVLAHAFDAWRLHPVGEPVFESANPRPPGPEPVDGLRLATLNVENYFLTLGERGAADAAALTRQREKLLATLRGLDADLVALVELENREPVLGDLLAHLNAAFPEEDRYRALEGPRVRGSDRIKVALIYRPRLLEALTPVLLDTDRVHRRPPAAAVFRPRSGGGDFLAAVVHHKAKTGCPPSGDVDDGQGCWNRERTEQSAALVAFVSGLQADHGPAGTVLMGDFNSYAAEDPIRVLEAAGYHNLVTSLLPAERHYTYVFRGAAGMLDYIFADDLMRERVQAATVWHINADEPVFLGYDQPGGEAGLAAGEPWRSSDHDPVLIGIRSGSVDRE